MHPPCISYDSVAYHYEEKNKAVTMHSGKRETILNLMFITQFLKSEFFRYSVKKINRNVLYNRNGLILYNVHYYLMECQETFNILVKSGTLQDFMDLEKGLISRL